MKSRIFRFCPAAGGEGGGYRNYIKSAKWEPPKEVTWRSICIQYRGSGQRHSRQLAERVLKPVQETRRQWMWQEPPAREAANAAYEYELLC